MKVPTGTLRRLPQGRFATVPPSSFLGAPPWTDSSPELSESRRYARYGAYDLKTVLSPRTPAMLATSSGPRNTEPMIMAPNIDDYYRLALAKLKAQVQEAPDADALGKDTDEWTQYLVRK